MERDSVNKDKFIDLMYTHRLDAGTDVAKLWAWAQEGHDIKPLARVFIIDRLCQCLAAWECAAGAWRVSKEGKPEIDPGVWNWDEFVKELMVGLDEVI